MATMTAFKFATPDGAEQMLNLIEDLDKAQLISLEDAASVSWPEGKKKPKTHQLVELTGASALSGAFWGMLFGLIFFMPFFGMAMGAVFGALSGKFSDYGIDDSFIESISGKVTEGSSAVFLITSGAVVDKVSDAVRHKGWKFEILTTNLNKEQDAQLREDFGIA